MTGVETCSATGGVDCHGCALVRPGSQGLATGRTSGDGARTLLQGRGLRTWWPDGPASVFERGPPWSRGYPPPAVVDQAVVPRTQQDQVVQVGGAVVVPGDDVVGVATAGVHLAAGELTSAVAGEQGVPLPLGHTAPAQPGPQQLPRPVLQVLGGSIEQVRVEGDQALAHPRGAQAFEDGHDVGVTAQPGDRGDRDRRRTGPGQAQLAGPGAGHEVGQVDVDHQVRTGAAGRAGGRTAEEGLDQVGKGQGLQVFALRRGGAPGLSGRGGLARRDIDLSGGRVDHRRPGARHAALALPPVDDPVQRRLQQRPGLGVQEAFRDHSSRARSQGERLRVVGVHVRIRSPVRVGGVAQPGRGGPDLLRGPGRPDLDQQVLPVGAQLIAQPGLQVRDSGAQPQGDLADVLTGQVPGQPCRRGLFVVPGQIPGARQQPPGLGGAHARGGRQPRLGRDEPFDREHPALVHRPHRDSGSGPGLVRQASSCKAVSGNAAAATSPSTPAVIAAFSSAMSEPSRCRQAATCAGVIPAAVAARPTLIRTTVRWGSDSAAGVHRGPPSATGSGPAACLGRGDHGCPDHHDPPHVGVPAQRRVRQRWRSIATNTTAHTATATQITTSPTPATMGRWSATPR